LLLGAKWNRRRKEENSVICHWFVSETNSPALLVREKNNNFNKIKFLQNLSMIDKTRLFITQDNQR
jgi:hypothetical protein